LFLYHGIATENDRMVRRWKILREFRSGARRIGDTWDKSTTHDQLHAAVHHTLERMRPG
jgi:hypothetical protein